MRVSWSDAPKPYQDLSRAMGQAIHAAAKTAAVYGLGRVKERLSGVVLRYRKGALRRSARVEIVPHARDVEIVFRAGGDGVPYARIHEEGGVIVPRSRPYLVFKTARGWVSTKRVVMPKRPYLKPSAGEALVVLRRDVLRRIADMGKR